MTETTSTILSKYILVYFMFDEPVCVKGLMKSNNNSYENNEKNRISKFFTKATKVT